MCNDEKLLKYHLQHKKKAKYEMGNFVNNMVYPLLLLPDKKGKNMIKVTKIIIIKNTKIILSNLDRKSTRLNSSHRR